MLERSLSRTFRDLSTYFLLVAAFVAPLELGYHFFFRDVVQVRSLLEEVEELPAGRSLQGVDRERLEVARWTRTGMNGLQLLLIPLLVPAAVRIADASDRGEVPHLVNRSEPGSPPPAVPAALRAPGTLAVAAGITCLVGLLLRNLGNLVTEPLDFAAAWAIVGLSSTVARSAAAPFLLVTWAEVARSADRRREGERSPTANLH